MFVYKYLCANQLEKKSLNLKCCSTFVVKTNQLGTIGANFKATKSLEFTPVAFQFQFHSKIPFQPYSFSNTTTYFLVSKIHLIQMVTIVSNLFQVNGEYKEKLYWKWIEKRNKSEKRLRKQWKRILFFGHKRNIIKACNMYAMHHKYRCKMYTKCWLSV